MEPKNCLERRVWQFWDSGLENVEGEGSWKPAASAAPSTLGSVDRTRLGKVIGFFGRSVCPRVCVYLSRTVSEYSP